MTFLWLWAFLLLPLPWLVYRFSKPQDTGTSGALRVPFFRQLRQQLGNTPSTQAKPPLWKWAVLSLAWLCLLTALARPALVGREIPLPVEGRDIMLAIDLSGSMQARDLGTRQNRLDVVKSAAEQFIDARKGDRVGLILFSDRAYLQAPLTFDRQAVADLLQEAQVGLTGQQTAIGDAIAIGLKRLSNSKVETKTDSRVLVLLTDGANNAGVMLPLQATELAKNLGIKIYTIGVGGEGQVINTPFGRQRIANSELDEQTLQQIAELTGGRYFRATDAKGLQSVYQDIDQLEPIVGEPIFVRPEVALFYYPAAAALGLLCLLLGLSSLPNTAINKKNRIIEEKS